jgi:hypothetical protein
MASDSKEPMAEQPAPRDDRELPSARRLHIRSRMRSGLATSLAAGALEGPKKPPAGDE